MGWINFSNLWRAKRIKSRTFNTALSCNNCKIYSHKTSPSENMKTDLKTNTDIFIYIQMPDWHKNPPPVKHSPLLPISHHFNKIRWVCYTFVKLYCTTLRHINWLELRFISLPYISIVFPFLHTMTPYYSTVSIIECEILNIQLARTNRHSEMATMLFQKSQI